MCVVAAGQQLNGKIMRLWRWDQIGDSLELIERISSPVRSYSLVMRGFHAPRCCAFSTVSPASRRGSGSGTLSRSCQEGARRERVDPNYALIRQQIIVVGDQRPFRRCAQRCDFSIVPIPDEDKDASPPTQPVTAARIPIRYEKSGLGSTGPANSPSGWKRLRLPPSRGAEFGVGSSRSRVGSTGSISAESVRPGRLLGHTRMRSSG